MRKLEDAVIFMILKHANQKRKDGSPYFIHPLTVAIRILEKGYGLDYILAALFHDLLEDTDATEDEILSYSNTSVLEAVKLLTKTDLNKKSYIDDILANDIAKVVKGEDRIHNLQSAHTADIGFMERYLANTKEKYVGKFGDELDTEYAQLKALYDSLKYTYTIDTSVDGIVYRSNKDRAEIYDPERGWIECDKYFWADLGDNAREISEEEAEKLIKR